MNQPFTSSHFDDHAGNPAGGHSDSIGVMVRWQDGPLAVAGSRARTEPNGAFVETVLAIAYDRIAYYQQSRFNCESNAEAMRHIELALAALDRRTKDREARGVEGTHIA